MIEPEMSRCKRCDALVISQNYCAVCRRIIIQSRERKLDMSNSIKMEVSSIGAIG